MTTVYPQAVEEINRLFTVAWNANSPAAVGLAEAPEIRYNNLVYANPPPKTKYWCRISTQVISEEQATLSNCVVAPGQKHYQVEGLVFVQIFAPMVADASSKLRLLAVVARNAFRGKEGVGRIWFRNVRINELKPEESFYRTNIVGEFEFNEIG